MKSAYEIAMERMGGGEAPAPLSDEQKSALAELDAKYRAKIAEKEIFLSGQMKKARAQQDRAEMEALEKQMRSERMRLEEERDAAKDKIRRQS